ncbi:MAG: hypothetical protein AAF206_04270 [Bacteroidota bacterium]
MKTWLLFLPISVLLFACGNEPPGPEAPSFPNYQPAKGMNIVWIVAEDMSAYLPAFGDSTSRC